MIGVVPVMLVPRVIAVCGGGRLAGRVGSNAINMQPVIVSVMGEGQRELEYQRHKRQPAQSAQSMDAQDHAEAYIGEGASAEADRVQIPAALRFVIMVSP